MTEQSPSPDSGLKTLEVLADLSKVITSAAAAPQAMLNVLRLLCMMFDGEGAVFWHVDDKEAALVLKQTFHREGPRSTNFTQQSQAQKLRFGEGEAGHVWAEGEPRLSGQQTLMFPLFGTGTINGVISIINSSLNVLTDFQRTLLNVIGTQLGAFISMDGMMLRVQELENRNDVLAGKAHSFEQELRACKARVSRLHEENVQEALSNYRLFNRLSREIRTPLSGITSIIELLQRTDLNDKQREYTAIINESARVILDVVERLVEAGSRSNRHLAVVQLREEQAQRPTNSTKKLTDAHVLSVTGLVGSSEYIEPYATASGISCNVASRGSTALTMMRQALGAGRAFDVVFVEMVLPDMDGFEFAQAVQRDKQLSRVPLVLVSTFGAEEGEDSALSAGYHAHIARPLKQAQVVNAVQAILEGTSVDAAVTDDQTRSVPALLKGQRVILVAEDNPVNQKVALLQLKELGYYAEVVSDGREAVEAAKKAPFDAILMDLQMPHMNGLDATKEIRKWERQTGSHVPIIAMTANAMASDRDECLAIGMDDYLNKPVTYDQLSDVLSKWLDVESAQKQAEAPMENRFNSHLDFTPESQPSESAQPVDVAVLNDMLGSEEATEILKLFVVSSKELLDKINHSLAAHDAASLKEAAHTLKGACSSIGANSMWRECLELEKAAKADDWNVLPRQYAVLEHKFQEAKDFINNTV
ncbi:MAG TPA: response regulator [Candidatus Obscuribacterales bacterium]